MQLMQQRTAATGAVDEQRVAMRTKAGIRIAPPDDLAEPVLLLCSERARQGTAIAVDGAATVGYC